MALKHIKNKIKAVGRTSKVTKAMEAVSAVKMRKAQEKALSGRPYAEAALRILENVSASDDVKHHHFFSESKKSTRDCIIVVTSDKGLAGSLNSAVLKEAYIRIEQSGKDSVDLVCFGKKAYEHFLRRDFSIARHYLGIGETVNITDMEEVVSFLSDAYTAGSYRNVFVVYQNFISTFEQRPLQRKILPVSTDEIRHMIQDIEPDHGKYSGNSTKEAHPTYTLEENAEELLNTLLRTLVEIMLYHALLESQASEHSARMVAMKNATDKAKEVTRSLTLLFNKERQSVITAEVSEISGGIEAMKTA